MPSTGRHELQEHTGEMLLRIEAPSLADLFAEAGRALAEVLAEEPATIALGPAEDVSVEAVDRAALLVAWIDELVFRTETTGHVFPVIEVLSVGDRRIEARIRGGRPETWRTAVKAATWHRLGVVDEPGGGVSATVVLDV